MLAINAIKINKKGSNKPTKTLLKKGSKCLKKGISAFIFTNEG
jgi:hypothetical protein